MEPKRPAVWFAVVKLRDRSLRVRNRSPSTPSFGRALPPGVAATAVDFITGPLLDNPRRLRKPLTDQLAGIFSATPGRDWRGLSEIDESKREFPTEAVQTPRRVNVT